MCYTECMRHNPARVLNLRIPPDIRPRLDALARARQTSRHHVAVSALLSGVDRLEAGGDVASGTEPLAGAADDMADGNVADVAEGAAVRAAGAPKGLAAVGLVAVAVGEVAAPGGGAASEGTSAPAVGAPVAHPASGTAPRSAGMMGWWRSESLPVTAGSVTQ